MKPLTLVVLLIFVSLSAGCAYLDARSSDPLTKIDGLMKAQQYGYAREVIAKVPETHPDYPQVVSLRKELDQQAIAYEQSVLSDGKTLEQQGQWYQAQKRYRQALQRLPESEKLTAAAQMLELKQKSRVETLEVDLLLTQGEWLKQNLVIRNELALIASTNWLKESQRAELQKRSRKLAAELGRHGRIALEQGALARAEQLLSFAMQLHPSESIEEAQHELVKQQQAIADKQRQSIIQSRKFMRKKLVTSLQQAIEENQLSEASLFVTRIKLMGTLNEKEQQLVQQLASLVQKQVADDMTQGVELYGQGKYQQAIEVWRHVLTLEPDNAQAPAHIERAERILEKLQRLREDKAEE